MSKFIDAGTYKALGLSSNNDTMEQAGYPMSHVAAPEPAVLQAIIWDKILGRYRRMNARDVAHSQNNPKARLVSPRFNRVTQAGNRQAGGRA